jgi:hypothetical protein
MNHAPAVPPDVVRVVVEDVPELADRVRDAARRAREHDCAVELVDPGAAEDDHAGKARMLRLLDEALEVARLSEPGVTIRVGGPIELPRPRGA